jgi:hypothetical protein
MERFLKRHQGRHTGSITGFDRLLFRGILRSISYVEGLNGCVAKIGERTRIGSDGDEFRQRGRTPDR